jgi:hypothetical protein
MDFNSTNGIKMHHNKSVLFRWQKGGGKTMCDRRDFYLRVEFEERISKMYQIKKRCLVTILKELFLVVWEWCSMGHVSPQGFSTNAPPETSSFRPSIKSLIETSIILQFMKKLKGFWLIACF